MCFLECPHEHIGLSIRMKCGRDARVTVCRLEAGGTKAGGLVFIDGLVFGDHVQLQEAGLEGKAADPDALF